MGRFSGWVWLAKGVVHNCMVQEEDRIVILITGGAGFIGRNLLERLSGTSTVRIFDSLAHPCVRSAEELPSAELVVGDVRNREAVAEAMSGVRAVVHLAASGSVVESVNDPHSNFENNAEGTLNILEAASRAGVEKLIFASTGGALIGNAEPPVNELSLPKPISPYGASKLCGEAYCHAFAKSYGLGTVALRFGNVYGPFSAHKKGAVTTFIRALMEDRPIVIYGDGSASRDYIHVDDLCGGIVAALETQVPGGDVFHLASGRETTVLELADALRKIADKPNHPIELRQARAGEVTRNFATFEKANRTLGFEPMWALEEGLAATWEWFAGEGGQSWGGKAAQS